MQAGQIRILGYVDHFDNLYYRITPKRICTDKGTVMIGTRTDWTLPGECSVFPSDSPMQPIRWTRVPAVAPVRADAHRYF